MTAFVEMAPLREITTVPPVAIEMAFLPQTITARHVGTEMALHRQVVTEDRRLQAISMGCRDATEEDCRLWIATEMEGPVREEGNEMVLVLTEENLDETDPVMDKVVEVAAIVGTVTAGSRM
jgi:hypothetical protein